MKHKICKYIFTCYMSTKLFHEKLTCRVLCVKRQKSELKKDFSQDKFSLFYIDHKNYHFSVKLYEHTYITET
jgi:hypothetical protein